MLVQMPGLLFGMTKCVKVLRSKSEAKSMDQSQARIKPFQTVPTRIRACDWSMLFAFAFARNTLTHFVKQTTILSVDSIMVLVPGL